MIAGAKGEYVNPQLYNRNKAQENFYKLAKEFGMTPTTRTQMVAAAQEKSAMDDILGGP